MYLASLWFPEVHQIAPAVSLSPIKKDFPTFYWVLARAKPRFLGSYRAISPIRSQVELVVPVCHPQLFTGVWTKRFLKLFDRKCICKKAKVSRRRPKQNENVSVDNCSNYRYVFIYLFSKVRDPEKLREKYYKKRGFKADIICLLPLESLSSLIFCKYFKTVPYFCV